MPIVAGPSFPVTLWKPFQKNRPDEETLRRLFAKNGVTSLAVVFGAVSGGLAVRDFDLSDAYQIWAAKHPDDASILPTVRTSRGFHVYGRLDNECFTDQGDGELRAYSRHYVVLPPSRHPNGAVYAWLNPLPADHVQLPVLPSSLTTQQAQARLSNPSKPIACAHPREIEMAIARTLPTGPGQRNQRLFDLARLLKGIMPEAEPDELRAIVAEWHRQAFEFIRTKPFAESWADLVISWERVKRPAGSSFRLPADAADSDILPAIANRYDGNLRRLVALCWLLQRQWGDRAFPLGCRTAAMYLGVSPIRAWRLLRALEFDRIIHLVTKGKKQQAEPMSGALSPQKEIDREGPNQQAES